MNKFLEEYGVMLVSAVFALAFIILGVMVKIKGGESLSYFVNYMFNSAQNSLYPN